MGFTSQFRLLMWKNWLLHLRSPCTLVFEIAMPVCFACIILIIRAFVTATEVTKPTYYTPLDIHLPFLPYTEIGYAPDYINTQAIMADVVSNINNTTVTLQPFNTESDLVNYFGLKNSPKSIGIIFYGLANTSSIPLSLSYKLRPATADKQQWRTRSVYPFFQSNAPRDQDDPNYWANGTINVQSLVGEAIIKYWRGSNLSLEMKAVLMPYLPYIDDGMISVIQNQLPIFLLLSFILSVIQTTKAIVMEKEKRLKESMKLMGLLSSAHWTSWFFTAFIYLAVSMAIYAILFGIDLPTGSVLAKTNIGLFYVFLLCYSVALITFCFMISVFVQRANVAAAVAGILFFAFYMPYMFIQDKYQDMGGGQKIVLSLLFNMAMSFGANTIGLYEGTGAGAQWSNFREPASVDDNYSLLNAIIMLLFDSLIHLLITWYVENVRPGEYGVPKPFYFCFTPSYWCGGRQKDYSEYKDLNPDDKNFEKEPSHLRPGIQVCNLSKNFGRGKVAVNNMHLNMYDGQITVLLGHNGAGKTTTMSMLTGFIPPSSGTAIVNGYDINTNIVDVRKSLGLCPQHNILYDTLTVQEHLEFFAILKGMDRSRVSQEAEEMGKEIGLEYKRNEQSGRLSGGQKRKLSVGIALIAGSKVVVLDEPSSGMDPAARRQTWEVLQRHREGRTLLLTTHYMDEADVLGDRIAIMTRGVVKCCGSSLFLKKLFGTGYHLVIVKEPTCQVDHLTKVIQSKIDTAQLESVINAEVSYLLPDDKSSAFADLFRFIEQEKQRLGIISFGTSATTLEEVFLKAGDEYDEEESGPLKGISHHVDLSDETGLAVENNKDNSSNSVAVLSKKDYETLDGCALQWSRFKGLFVKKAILSWRHRVLTVVQLLLPVIFTIVALLIKITGRREESLLNFDLSPFGSTNIYVSNGTAPTFVTNLAARAYYDAYHSSNQKVEMVNVASGSFNNLSTYLLERDRNLGPTTFNKKVIIAAEFEISNGTGDLSPIAYFNGQPYHALPISVAYLLNGLAKYFLNDSYSISISMEPLPKGPDASAKDSSSTSSLQGFFVGFCISFGMAFLSSSFIFPLVKERSVGSKHMQVVSGVGPWIFWLATMAWDYLNYLLVCFAMLIVFTVFHTEAYVNDDRLGLVLLVLIIYGWATLGFVYAIHYVFKSAPTSMVMLIMFNIVTGMITTVAVTVLSMPNLGTQNVSKVFDWLFMIFFPNYCMTKSFMDIYTNYLTINTCISYKSTCPLRPGPCCSKFGKCFGFCLEFQEDYLAWSYPGVGRFIFFMVLQGCLFLAITLAVDYHLFERMNAYIKDCRKTPKIDDKNNHVALSPLHRSLSSVSEVTPSEDSDVVKERERINNASADALAKTDSLILMNLCKKYGSFTAVRTICVGVPEQECFGLLGQNGAGKTTTFKMLTGDVTVTSGNAYLKSYDIVHQIKKVQQNMGYCPQFDALLDQMTGRETLVLYARLKGVPESSIQGVVNNLIGLLLLQPHADKLAGFYSGGNKRKLSTAMALIGDPPFILLDEPSAGVDPAARRQLWNVLSQIRASGKTLVLTSHSMEECDALCTRIAIMVNGEFKCLGSPQHLKNKFGQGYTLIVKMGLLDSGLLAPHEPVVDLVVSTFQGARVFDNVQGYVHFQVPDTNAHVADVFSLMERAKSELYVEDYSVHQTTLEQIFLTFTRRQAAPKEDKPTSALDKLCCCSSKSD